MALAATRTAPSPQSARPARRARAIVFMPVLAAPLACAQLNALPPGICGNGVVEGSEQCDMHEDPALGPGTHCADPSDALHACHYVCSRTNPNAPVCPTGWGCSVDGTCRFASGRFQETAESPVAFPEPFQDLQLVDVDGDGNPDLSALSESSLSVRFGKNDATFPAEFDFAAESRSSFLATGDLDRDGRQDTVLATDLGAVVLLGDRDRTLAPELFTQFQLPLAQRAAGLQLVQLYRAKPPLSCVQVGGSGAGGAGAGGAAPRDTVVAVTVRDRSVDLTFPATGDLGASLTATQGYADRPSRLVSAKLDSAADHESLLVALSGDSVVRVYAPGCVTGGKAGAHFKLTLEAVIPLPLGYKVARRALPSNVREGDGTAAFIEDTIHVGDRDGDGVPDVLISVERSNPGSSPVDRYQVAVALGTGGASFQDAVIDRGFDAVLDAYASLASSDPSAPLRTAVGAQRWPLAFGKIDGDDLADVVSTGGVLVNTSTTYGTYFPPALGFWSEAVLGDFDGDGHTDVAAISPDSSEIEIDTIDPTSSVYNTFLVDTHGHPTTLRVGDFDGDGLDDIAYVDSGVFIGSTLNVVYGSHSGFGILPMGQVDVLCGVEVIRLDDGNTTDLSLVSSASAKAACADPFEMSTLFGRTARTMLSPFQFRDAAVPVAQSAPAKLERVLVGRFAGWDEALDLLALDSKHMWIAPGNGAGKFSTTATQATVQVPVRALLPDVSTLRPNCALFGITNIDGNSHADDVISVLQSDCVVTSTGALPGMVPDDRTLRVVGRVRAPRVEDGVILEATQPLTSLGIQGDVLAMVLADVDRNDQTDVILTMGPKRDQQSGVITGTSAPAVAVLWNPVFKADLATMRATLTFSDPPSIIPVGHATSRPLAVAALNADDDIALELAVVTYEESGNRGGRGSANVYLVHLKGKNAAVAPAVAISNPIASLGSPAIQVADLDGDGLTDIVVSDGQKVHVYTSVPSGVEVPR